MYLSVPVHYACNVRSVFPKLQKRYPKGKVWFRMVDTTMVSSRSRTVNQIFRLNKLVINFQKHSSRQTLVYTHTQAHTSTFDTCICFSVIYKRSFCSENNITLFARVRYTCFEPVNACRPHMHLRTLHRIS